MRKALMLAAASLTVLSACSAAEREASPEYAADAASADAALGTGQAAPALPAAGLDKQLKNQEISLSLDAAVTRPPAVPPRGGRSRVLILSEFTLLEPTVNSAPVRDRADRPHDPRGGARLDR